MRLRSLLWAAHVRHPFYWTGLILSGDWRPAFD